MAIDFVSPSEVGAGFFKGADPDWQLKQQQVAATDAFKTGVPTNPDGSLNTSAMVKTLFQKGAYGPASELLTVGNQQRAIQLGLDSADRLDGSKPSQAPSSYVRPTPGFDSSVSRTLGFEGGLNPHDTNGTPSNYGINQAAHPNIDVTKLTPDQAKAIYKSDYWDAIGGDNLSPGLARAAFDTAVIAGPEKAKQFIAASGGDPMKLMDLREKFQNGLLASNPQKYGPYANAWAARNNGLRYDIAALNASDGASAPSATPDATAAPVRVAQNGTSDAPSSIHPYAPSAPATTGPAAAAGAPSNPPSVLGAASPATTSAVDPTLGGLLPSAYAGNPGGYITQLRAQAVRLATLGGTAAANAYNQQATMVENALTRSETPEIKNYAAAVRQGYKGSMMDYAHDVEVGKLTAKGDPRSLRAEGQSAEAAAAGAEQGKVPYELVPMQPTPGGPTVMVPKAQVLSAGTPMAQKQPATIDEQQKALGTKISAIPDQLRQRQITRERIDAMSSLLDTFQSGADADTKAAAIAKARAWGINIPDSATASPTAVEQFAKNAQANVFAQIKDQGGKVLVSEIQGFQKANANSNMQPESNAAILAQQKGLLDWQDAHDQALINWYHQHPYAYDSSDFETKWEKDNRPRDYVAAARKEIAPLGIPLPPKDKLIDGQAYNVKGQKARWNASANGFVPMQAGP